MKILSKIKRRTNEDELPRRGEYVEMDLFDIDRNPLEFPTSSSGNWGDWRYVEDSDYTDPPDFAKMAGNWFNNDGSKKLRVRKNLAAGQIEFDGMVWCDTPTTQTILTLPDGFFDPFRERRFTCPVRDDADTEWVTTYIEVRADGVVFWDDAGPSKHIDLSVIRIPITLTSAVGGGGWEGSGV